MEFRAAALLFDLDGVLVDSHAVVERTWRRWAVRHGLDAGPLLAVAHGRRTRDTLKAVVPHLDPAPEVAWLDAAELQDLEGVVAVAGAAPLLAALANGRWAVVTSCGRALAAQRLEQAGLPLPPVLVTSEDVARGKPAPDGYLLAAERSVAAPASCLVFEDAPPGIAAARAAGCRVVALATTHAADRLADAEALVPDLRSVGLRPDGGDLVVTIR
ncbi:MAG TPA: HAD-IA family hydrolase [Gemmatimonadales bacterium]|nr:HAD-IA family hydrolase [Gemmatimonadales bacterium]